MTQQQLVQHQVWLYLALIVLGALLGYYAPSLANMAEPMLWPLLAILLYTTFTPISLANLRNALRNRRFLVAAIIGNFLIIPALVGALLWLVPDAPAIRLGVLLVLLVPCTDWFISFTHLAKGSTHDAIAFSPLSLLLQLLLLPLYLALFMGSGIQTANAQKGMLLAFGGLIVLPLMLAWWTQRYALPQQSARKERLINTLGWLPIPLLALIVGLIAATQILMFTQSIHVLLNLVPVFVLFLLASLLLAWGLSKACQLSAAQERTLVFSFGTRNSFVVLPLALMLPDGLKLAASVIVLQSLVELLGMMLFLRCVPKIFPENLVH